MSSLLSEQKTPLVPPTTYIPIWVPVNSPAEKIARAKEELKDVGASGEASQSETSGKDTDSNGKKVDDEITADKLVASKPLLDAASGLTPGMKKMKVDNRPSSEDGEGELPKPKRERKKSKSKSGEIEKVADGTVTVEKIVAKPEEEKSVAAKSVDEKTKATKLSADKNKEDGNKDEVAIKPKDASLDPPKTPKKPEVKITAKGVSKSPKGIATSADVAATKSPVKEVGKTKSPDKGKKSPNKKGEVSKEEGEKLAK